LIDRTYTDDDHSFRENDPYASAKYSWTIRKLLTLASGTSLLNVGCGAGHFNVIADSAGFQVTAIEPDPTAHALALECAPPRCRILNQSLAEFETSGEFDVVVAHDVIEHIADDQSAVRKMVRLVRPGGLIIGSVPALQLLFGIHDERLGHYRRYSHRKLRRLLAPNLESFEVRYYGLTGIPIALIYSKLLRRSYPAGSTSSNVSVLAKLFRLICEAEARVPVPIGSSLLFLGVRKKY
jgi:SAM-dependent methyltransferase